MADVLISGGELEIVPHKDFNKVVSVLRQEWVDLAKTHSIITHEQAMERFDSLDIKEVFDSHRIECENKFGMDQRTSESMALGLFVSFVVGQMERLEKQNRPTLR